MGGIDGLKSAIVYGEGEERVHGRWTRPSPSPTHPERKYPPHPYLHRQCRAGSPAPIPLRLCRAVLQYRARYGRPCSLLRMTVCYESIICCTTIEERLTGVCLVGLNSRVLLGWVGVSCVALPVFQWAVRRRQMRGGEVGSVSWMSDSGVLCLRRSCLVHSVDGGRDGWTEIMILICNGRVHIYAL
ncbi:hypothetical protein DFH09DRAFT_200005 [Mycena vulgaris]|nr:hypothetical protein DFH09DRAFT_200005 [Mycena vulgaris]